ncbi:MAG: site-2 protease family protein [Parcubacteria group bacterium]|nr:site-2 protease family protein [Parcubacteria group bacterium]
MTIELLAPLIAILIVSVVAHEVAHGYIADMLGDPTARLAGRLTLNPLKHLDLWGSFIIPLLLALSPAKFIIGWAKPVPYNPHNLSDQRWGEALVAAAGPGVNIALALIFALLLRIGAVMPAGDVAVQIVSAIVYINLLLAFFNLIPVPPLDGSKILAAILPFHLEARYRAFQERVFRYGILATFVFIFVFLYLIWPFFFRFLLFVFELFTGMPLGV